MMPFHIRLAVLADVPALTQLITDSVRRLNAPDYTAAQIESALQYIYGVDTQLIADGTYFAVEQDGRIVGCGGWSKRKTLFGGDQAEMARDDSTLLDPTNPAKIRAFFVHPDCARQGIGRAIMTACEEAARRDGFTKLELMATLTGEYLYAQTGFIVTERLDISLPDGTLFPTARMVKTINPAHDETAVFHINFV